MILLPSRGRPENIARFMVRCVATEATAPITIILDSDDLSLGEYKSMNYPENFTISISDSAKRGGIVALFNEYFNNNPDKPWYGILGDDVVPHTPRWDWHLSGSCVPDGISWARDGLQNENLPTHPFIGGDLVREWGYIAPPSLKHYFADDWWKDEAKGRKCGLYRDDIYLEHMHPIAGKAPMDDTYTRKMDMSEDRAAYEKHKEDSRRSA